MPRQPRLELPGVPMHVVQRGVNRCAIGAGAASREASSAGTGAAVTGRERLIDPVAVSCLDT